MTWSLAALLQAALDLFEAQWEELIGMPSRQSAAEDPEVRRCLAAGQSQAIYLSRILTSGSRIDACQECY